MPILSTSKKFINYKYTTYLNINGIDAVLGMDLN